MDNTELTLEDMKLMNKVLQELDEALDSYIEQDTKTVGLVASVTGLLQSCAKYKSLYDRIKKLNEKLSLWKKNTNLSAEKYGLPKKTLDSHKVKLHWRKKGGNKPAKTLEQVQRETAEGNPALMKFLKDAQEAYDKQPRAGSTRTLVVNHNPNYKPRAKEKPMKVSLGDIFG